MRRDLVETAVMQDAAVLAAYLSDFADPAPAALRACVRAGTLGGAFVPVLCGSSYRNKGVQQMLDAVADFLPSPLDVEGIQTVGADGMPDGGRIAASDGAAFAALAFKGVDDRFGSLTFARIYAGTVRPGDTVLNATRGERLTVGRIGEMHAANLEPLAEAHAGQIVAFVSLGDTRTGDTLCAPSSPVVLERMSFPEPVVSSSVEAVSRGDQDRLSAALVRMARMDPSLRFEQDRETGECVLRGMGELHLEVTLDRARTEHGVTGRLGEPQVAFRETISRAVEHVHTHRKQTGGSGQFAEVRIRFEPLPERSGFVFEDATVGGSVPRAYVPAVGKAIGEESQNGVIGGYPTVGFKAVLLDGRAHAVDSSALAFGIAARACFREAMALAGPVLLEPVMTVVTLCPDECVGAAMGEIARRRGQVTGQRRQGAQVAVEAEMPLMATFGLVGALRSLSSGRASASMLPGGHAEAPAHVRERFERNAA
jgi:elongation factor G